MKNLALKFIILIASLISFDNAFAMLKDIELTDNTLESRLVVAMFRDQKKQMLTLLEQGANVDALVTLNIHSLIIHDPKPETRTVRDWAVRMGHENALDVYSELVKASKKKIDQVNKDAQ